VDAHGLRSGIGLLKDLVTYEKEYLNLFSSNNHEQTYGPRVCHFNFNDWTDAQVFGTNVTILSCPHFLLVFPGAHKDLHVSESSMHVTELCICQCSDMRVSRDTTYLSRYCQICQ
jgi:hypothetical protein